MTTYAQDLFSLEKRSFFVPLSKTWCEQVWAEHKYLVMLTSYCDYKEIAQAFKDQIQLSKQQASRDWTAFADWLCNRLEEVKQRPVEEENARNALTHAIGHLRGRLSEEEAGSWHLLLSDDWKRAWKTLFLLAMERGDEYLKESRLFSPDCPVANIWVRVRGKDWFIHKSQADWVILTAEQVVQEVADCKVSKLVEYRLMAQLEELTNPLEIYEKCKN
ncbi:DUF1722 domain-containing protein [Brevibacillus ginsengisoli]|uniref:DUF1722 domain-containing protein n=1 Tax=Brevibacillus ginsengisoli TaxID=363854 RepID=UPI003CF16BDA